MGDLVSDGESFRCPFCTGNIKLAVSSSPMQGDGKNIANTDNYSLSAPGAQCIVIPSSPAPCNPSEQSMDPDQSPLKIEGSPALGAGCKFLCAKGGLITVSASAQSAAMHDGASGAAVAATAVGAAASIPTTESKKEKP